MLKLLHSRTVEIRVKEVILFGGLRVWIVRDQSELDLIQEIRELLDIRLHVILDRHQLKQRLIVWVLLPVQLVCEELLVRLDEASKL